MKGKFVAGAGLWLAVVILVPLIRSGFESPVAAQGKQTPPGAARQVPKFRVDPSWPKVPNGWVWGQVSSVAVDDQDHIWVLHRPSTIGIRHDTLPVKPGSAGPPVMVFDATGNYLHGWGGPGKGYDWPESEHGIFVDYKGYVWIGGQGNEDQILKFTKDGKFVMQIGHGGQKKTNADTKNFWKPADVFVYPKTNELFVADGYGNKRIIVFDADTGAYKRMWGAFGNVPKDDPPTPPAARGSGPAAPPPLEPADGPPQFVNPVHAVKVSNDGLVYVADRGGRRVQVFTLDGKFVKQVFIDRSSMSGQTAAGVAFSPDPGQQFLYVASRTPQRIWVFDRRTLEPLDSFGRPGVAPGEFMVLHHLASDSKGNLYSAEVEDGKRPQKFTFMGMSPVASTPAPK
jgi:DNA-binding beta-propeller fold protein YncE